MTRAWKEPPGEWIEDRDEPEGPPLAFWHGLIVALLLVAPFWIALAWMVI
jgi:hypothetical protein